MIIDIYKAQKGHKKVWVAIPAGTKITEVTLPDDIKVSSNPFKNNVDTTQTGVIGLPPHGSVDKEINDSGYSIF